MSRIAVIFPGQGSQYVGMGREFYEHFSLAKKAFDEADGLLEYPLSTLIFEGPEDELKKTYNTQPAILVASLAIWNVINDELFLEPAYFAGHSLGEYTALAAAGALSFHDAVRLVRNRGRFMEDAVPHGEGAMAAMMGIEREELEAICQKVTDDGHSVQLANINAPNQIVISGTKQGVEMAGVQAKEKGAKRVIPLPVSGPFHSRLMEPAKERLTPFVNEAEVNKANIPVVMNVNAKEESNPAQVKKNLIEQVVSPVLWSDSVEFMINNGVDTFIEIGPSKVLSGLVKKINRSVQVFSVEDLASYQEFKEKLLVLKGGY